MVASGKAHLDQQATSNPILFLFIYKFRKCMSTNQNSAARVTADLRNNEKHDDMYDDTTISTRYIHDTTMYILYQII